MTRTYNAALPVVLLVSALALSACATKKEEPAAAAPQPAAEQAAPEAVPAAPPVTEQPAAEQPAPAPVTTVEAPPKRVVKKHKKVAKPAPPKVAEPVQVAPPPPPPPPPAPAPAPVPVVQEPPAPPPVMPAPVPQPAEESFLQKYWLWLVGVIAAAGAILLAIKRRS